MTTALIIEENSEDLFDRLPDAIILTIFDKLQDAKSLCISSSLCKRFHFLTSQTHHISLTLIPPHKSHLINTNKNQFIRLLDRLFLKPFQFVVRQVKKWNTDQKNNMYKCCTCTYGSPVQLLTSFSQVKELEIRLPSEGGDKKKNISDHPLLKWKAEFDSQLKNCLIVGGTSLSLSLSSICSKVFGDVPVMQRGGDSLRMTNEDLKLRVVWILSTLIAASARHCLIEETIKEKKRVNSVVILDDHGQGKCCMNGEQVEEMRRNMGSFSTKMPALKVKMWYVPELELPEEGCVMKGATLVVIKPVEEWSKVDDGRDLVDEGFGFGGDGKEEVFDEVARELVKLERSYSLEMNSF